MINRKRTSSLTRLASALLAISLSAVVLTTSPVGAESSAGPVAGSSVVVDPSEGPSDRSPAARTTTAGLIERPEFAVTACPEITDSVLRLYSAYFLRAPDAGGFDFWLDEYSSGGWSLPRMSEFFSQSPEFERLYGGVTDAEFIDLIYINIFGRAADEGGRTYWLNRMEAEGLNRGTVMLFFSESPEYIDQTGTVTPLAGDFNWLPSGAEWFCGYGDFDSALPTGTHLDLFAYNDNDFPIDITIQELVNDEWMSAVVTLEPGGYLAAFGLPMPETSTGVALTSRSGFFWSMVHSQTPTPRERAGWVFD